jgi:hypothetical protein
MGQSSQSDRHDEDQDLLIELFLDEIRHGAQADVDAFLARFPDSDPSLREALQAVETIENALASNASTPYDAALALQGFQGSERFTILGQLGAGGMGAVYEVRDKLTHANVALKLLPRVESSSLSRFKAEFRGLAELHDPRFLKLYELYGEGKCWYFTMERIDGSSLAEWLRGAR